MSNATNLFDLTGKRALVTGASGGIGRHFAKTLAAQGAQVTLVARRADALDQAQAQLASDGLDVEIAVLDVSREDDVKAFFAAQGAFDVIVNNAGVSRAVRLIEATGDDFDRIMSVNLRAAFSVATEGARALRAAGRPGAIVNITSILAQATTAELGLYASSKAALLHMTRAMALEWARFDIRVNALSPGYILTEMTREFFESKAGETTKMRIPFRRIGQPEDLDGALLLLVSDAGRFMTGSDIVVDGGHLVAAR